MKTKKLPETFEKKQIAPDTDAPPSRLASVEALLRSTSAKASKDQEAVRGAQDELQPYVERAEQALRTLQAIVNENDNEALLRKAMLIDFDQWSPKFGRKFGDDPESLRERDRVSTARVVHDLNAVYFQTRDRLHAISRRVAALSVANGDLAPVQFDGEEWNRYKAGRYPVEVGRIKRHVGQLIKTVAGMPDRFDELHAVLDRFSKMVAKYAGTYAPVIAVAVSPDEAARRAEDRPSRQDKADADFSGYSN